MSELKPCPFCGGVAHIEEDMFNGSSESYVNYLHGECSECGARSKMVNAWSEKANAAAIAAWNTRA